MQGSEPKFRKGIRLVTLRYIKLGPKAGECLVNLVECGQNYLRFSYNIALAMSGKSLNEGWRTVRGRRRWDRLATVSPRYVTLYRRAFDGLGLVEASLVSGTPKYPTNQPSTIRPYDF